MRNPFEFLYIHKLTLYRWADVEDGAITNKQRVQVCSDVRCRYSAGGKQPRGVPDPALRSSHVLFTGRDVDVKEGDDAEVTLSDGSVIYLKIGEVHPYTFEYQANAERSEHA